MKIGKLYYDGNLDRYDMRYENGGEYGGFHCGEVIEVRKDEEWKKTRFEYSHRVNGGWYLVGLDISPAYVSFYGYPVRLI